MRLVLLAAVGHRGAIGINNTLPWHLPEDLRRFKALTTGKTVVMGRKTFDSIVERLGKPLPNRKSLVLTRNKDWFYPGGQDVSVLHSLDDLDHSGAFGESGDLNTPVVYVIGGAQVYEATIERADELDITEVDIDAKGADAFFPEIDPHQWNKRAGEWKLSEKGLSYRYVTYLRHA